MSYVDLTLVTMLSLIINVSGITLAAQTSKGIEDSPGRASRLVRRYEQRSSMFRVIEHVQVLRGPGSEEWKRENIVIRICSRTNFLSSVPSAALDPLELTDLFTRLGYTDQQIVFLRSEDCLSPYPDIAAVEVWVADENSDLPANLESYRNDQLKMISLGFDPVECVEPDYRRAVRKLIKTMRSDPNSYGAIVKYYLASPSKSLLTRSAASQKLLERAGIPSSRVIAISKAWHHGDSACVGREPNQPMILYLSTNNKRVRR